MAIQYIIPKYKSIHNWMYRQFGRPLECENCQSTTAKSYDWAIVIKEWMLKHS